MRLNVVARTVIVASAFWMAGGTYLIAKNAEEGARATADARYKQCITPRPPEGYICWESWDKIYEGHTSKLEGGLWGSSATKAAIYLVFALIVFAVLYGSVRWVLAGREQPSLPGKNL